MPQKTAQKLLNVGDLVLDLYSTTLNKGSDVFHLTPKEAKLISVLMNNVGQVVSRKQLMTEVWHNDDARNTRTLDVHIHWLRQKIEDDPIRPEYILTRRSLGYELRVSG